MVDNAAGKVCGKYLAKLRAGGIEADRTGGRIGAVIKRILQGQQVFRLPEIEKEGRLRIPASNALFLLCIGRCSYRAIALPHIKKSEMQG